MTETAHLSWRSAFNWWTVAMTWRKLMNTSCHDSNEKGDITWDLASIAGILLGVVTLSAIDPTDYTPLHTLYWISLYSLLCKINRVLLPLPISSSFHSYPPYIMHPRLASSDMKQYNEYLPKHNHESPYRLMWPFLLRPSGGVRIPFSIQYNNINLIIGNNYTDAFPKLIPSQRELIR